MSPDTAHSRIGSSNGIASVPPPGTRSAEQIRNDIVARRRQLGRDVDSLRGRVNELTDWRGQLRKHRSELIAGAAVIGAVAGTVALLRWRSKR
ncbi:MAG: DUF3618 domain-containing protein [Solirubrobacterales bacterium]